MADEIGDGGLFVERTILDKLASEVRHFHNRDFLKAAKQHLKPDGMLVVEVPRADCLSTAVLSQEGAVVARHLDPTSHVNLFSDKSLFTLLRSEGFEPVAVWYFGMDAYEFFVQSALSWLRKPIRLW